MPFAPAMREATPPLLTPLVEGAVSRDSVNRVSRVSRVSRASRVIRVVCA